MVEGEQPLTRMEEVAVEEEEERHLARMEVVEEEEEEGGKERFAWSAFDLHEEKSEVNLEAMRRSCPSDLSG